MITDRSVEDSDKTVRLGVLDDEDKVAGALTAVEYGKAMDITSLYIMPQYRRKGYAKALLDVLYGNIKGLGYEAITGEFFYEEEAAAFCSRCGFDMFKGRPQHFFTLKEFLRSPLYNKLIKDSEIKGISYVKDLSQRKRRVLDKYLGFDDYDTDWSTANVRAGVVKSYMLVKKRARNVNVLQLYSIGDDSMEFLQHIRALTFKSLETFGEKDATIRMSFERDKIIENFRRLLGGKEHLHLEGQYMRAVRLI